MQNIFCFVTKFDFLKNGSHLFICDYNLLHWLPQLTVSSSILVRCINMHEQMIGIKSWGFHYYIGRLGMQPTGWETTLSKVPPYSSFFLLQKEFEIQVHGGSSTCLWSMLIMKHQSWTSKISLYQTKFICNSTFSCSPTEVSLAWVLSLHSISVLAYLTFCNICWAQLPKLHGLRQKKLHGVCTPASLAGEGLPALERSCVKKG